MPPTPAGFVLQIVEPHSTDGREWPRHIHTAREQRVGRGCALRAENPGHG